MLFNENYLGNSLVFIKSKSLTTNSINAVKNVCPYSYGSALRLEGSKFIMSNLKGVQNNGLNGGVLYITDSAYPENTVSKIFVSKYIYLTVKLRIQI